MGLFDFVGGLFGAEGSGDAANLYNDAANRWDDFEIKSPEEQARKARELYESGLISPEEYEAVLQDPSLLDNYTGDPRLQEAKMGALEHLMRTGREGGMTAVDRAQLNDIQNRNAVAARGARGANTMRARQQGRGGGGMEQVQNMIADQGAATANYLGGTNVAANSQMRALDAITKGGQFAGEIDRDQFSQAERKAAAADKINRFNTTNRNAVAAANVQGRNLARDRALAMQADEEARKKGKLQEWTSAYTGAAPYRERQGQQTGDFVGGVLNAGADTIGGFMMSDEQVKDDIAPATSDLEEFLANLEPQKWDYTDQKYGSTDGQENYGVMAQDMEKSPVGQSFVDEDAEGVKRIDYGKAQGTMMAIIKSLSDRLDGLEGNSGT